MKKKFPKTVFVGRDIEDPEFLLAFDSRDQALDSSDDGEPLAEYQLVQVGQVSVKRDIKPISGKRKR